MRFVLLASALLLVTPVFTACDQPMEVNADPKRLKRLPLRGDVDKEGTLIREVKFGDKVLKKGTRVVVRETWIARRDPKADPPGYRIGGHYDATRRTDGFVLPPGRADIFFVSALLPQDVGRIPIPIEAVQIDP